LRAQHANKQSTLSKRHANCGCAGRRPRIHRVFRQENRARCALAPACFVALHKNVSLLANYQATLAKTHKT
jgi:hypothetical protein